MFIISGPPLISFILNCEINKDLKTFLSFPDLATHLTLENNLGISVGSKPEKFKNIEAQKKATISAKSSWNTN